MVILFKCIQHGDAPLLDQVWKTHGQIGGMKLVTIGLDIPSFRQTYASEDFIDSNGNGVWDAQKPH